MQCIITSKHSGLKKTILCDSTQNGTRLDYYIRELAPLFSHFNVIHQSGNTGRRAAEVIDELTDFGGLSNITSDTVILPKVREPLSNNLYHL